jgi:formylglycine-generating enzyme required for sulfatase activity
MIKKLLVALSVLFLVQLLYAQEIPKGFVYIKGGIFQPGRNYSNPGRAQARLLPFEMLDHTVTNREYFAFTSSTSYKTPQHWTGGEIPAGFEDYPVIYVNRADVREYLRWLSQNEDRVYRLPTRFEYEFASRGGKVNNIYPWGNNEPSNRANYDEQNQRAFPNWQKFLKPTVWGKRNGYGLYNMSGNVWNMATSQHDPATQRWKYRIEDPGLLEQSIMGGSWARSAEYLKCGYSLGLSMGITHPDVGFRPVRAPKGANREIVNRKLSGVTIEDNGLLISWAMLQGDKQADGFNVYRSDNRLHAGFKMNDSPINRSTSFVDKNVQSGHRYQYYVKPVKAGQEGSRSEWLGVTVDESESPVINTFAPLFKQGSLVPIFGDLNGDGTYDCVVRMDNGNSEMSQDPGLPVQLEAFTSYGRSLWRKDICYHDYCFGSANNVPFNVWDMDGDNKAEIITRLQIGNEVFVAILDGIAGELKYKTKWPEMISDFQRSSTRIHLSIAYLDGKTPAVITQTGLYENEVFTAFDNELNQLWEFKSTGATNGSGGHKIEVADVNGDGKQEVFDGTTCLNADGSIRWSIYKQHPDIVSIHDYLPERPGLEVFYIVESSIHAGVYMVDANSGEIIWKVNREDDPRWTHGHSGWTADFWAGSSGIECISNRQGHSDRNYVLFSAEGKALLEPFPAGYSPIEWDGDETRELLTNSGRTIGNFDGQSVIHVENESPNPFANASFLMVADLYGDFRDELVLTGETKDGGREIIVVSNPKPINKKYITAGESLDYMLWIGRNMGGGYRSIYDMPLELE